MVSKRAPCRCLIAQIVERIRFDQLHVVDAVARAIVGRTLERARGDVECNHRLGTPREVERE